jgi:hypothetical protein
MDHLGYIAAALCALSLLSAVLQLAWLLRRPRAPPSAAHERKFHNFKVFRTCLLACIAASQLALTVAKLVEQRGAVDSIALGNAAVGACWSAAVVGGAARQRRPALGAGRHVLCAKLAGAGRPAPPPRRDRVRWCWTAWSPRQAPLGPTCRGSGQSHAAPRTRATARGSAARPRSQPPPPARAQVVLLIKWRSQAALKLPGALSLFLLQAGGLLALDVTQRTTTGSGDIPDLDAEHIARWAGAQRLWPAPGLSGEGIPVAAGSRRRRAAHHHALPLALPPAAGSRRTARRLCWCWRCWWWS